MKIVLNFTFQSKYYNSSAIKMFNHLYLTAIYKMSIHARVWNLLITLHLLYVHKCDMENKMDELIKLEHLDQHFFSK
jgi:hypothetical protein